jgi:class 3 adenylate cyclase
MNAWLFSLILIVASGSSSFLIAQAPASAPPLNAYQGQLSAIEEMLSAGSYQRAITQSEALIAEGQNQRLSDVEAYGHYLLGRALLQDPASTGQDRIRGVRELRRASTRFSDSGMTATVDSIAEQLRDLAGDESQSITGLPRIAEIQDAGQPVATAAEDLDETTLNAIVALQSREIEALTDTQLRQLILLQQKDMEIDSFETETLQDSLQLMQQRMDLDEQRALTREERQRRNFFLVLALGVIVALALLYLRYRSSQRYQQLLSEKNDRIEQEQQRSNELLLNILPAPIARELKDKGAATARRHEEVSVMFSDFVGFSRIAGSQEPERLVEMLDRTFRAFDEIIARHGLEKIKTIGDAYMCAAGLPKPQPDHAERAVAAALEIQEYLEREGDFRARIGIHSGPVVAGVVGQKKFAYDVWGDTVNQASRLEKAGRAGSVTVSATTRELLGDRFDCTHSGTFEAKNIGTLDRYEVRASRLTKNPS